MPPPPQRRRRGVSCPSNILPFAGANPPKAAEEDEDQEMGQPRRNGARDESESEEDAEPEGNDPDDDAGEDSTNGELVKKLVRYALACEFSRTPIRRDGIKERGLLSRSVLGLKSQLTLYVPWKSVGTAWQIVQESVCAGPKTAKRRLRHGAGRNAS